MGHEDTHGSRHEDAMRRSIQDAVRIGDDDALERVVEELRKLRFVEARRVLGSLKTRELRRVAETAISLTRG